MNHPADQPIVCPTLIGRAAALATLAGTLDHVQDGHGRTLLIAGEAGLGKTRLVIEAQARATARGWRVLSGQCSEIEQGVPYAPLTDLLARVPAADLTAALPAPQQIPPELAALLPHTVIRPDRDTPTKTEQDKHRLFLALVDLLARLAADRPLLLVVEDLHWSDRATLDALLYTARRLESGPVLLLLTFREDEINPDLMAFLAQLDRLRLAGEIRLSPLERDDVDKMLRAIFRQARPLRATFLDAFYPLTDGNPFLIEEALKSLVMAGEIAFDADNVWFGTSRQGLEIPRSVQDAVQRRTAQLSAPARQVLTLAAVAGRRFNFDLLRALAGIDESELLARLKELIAAQLLVEESVDRFVFRHALTREAVYATLLTRERVQLHARIAVTLEELYAPQLDAHLADLAYHSVRGHLWERTLRYSRQIGENALAIFAAPTAVEHFSHALEAAGHRPELDPGDLYHRRGLAYAQVGDFAAAAEDFRRALDLADACGDDRRRWETLLALGNLWATRDYVQTGAYFTRAHALATGLDDPGLIARSLISRGNWHMNMGEPGAALRDQAAALAIFRARADRRGIAETLDMLAISSYNAGDVIRGRAFYAEALPLWRELDDKQGLLHTLSGLGLAADFDVCADPVPVAQALVWSEEGVSAGRALGWRAGETLALICHGLVLRHCGALGAAFTTLQQGLALADEIEHREWMVDALCALGALYLDLLATDRARPLLETALAQAHVINSAIWINFASLWLAGAQRLQGDYDAADATLDAVLPADAPMETLAQRSLWLARGEVALARGEYATALAVADRLIDAAQRTRGDESDDQPQGADSQLGR